MSPESSVRWSAALHSLYVMLLSSIHPLSLSLSVHNIVQLCQQHCTAPVMLWQDPHSLVCAWVVAGSRLPITSLCLSFPMPSCALTCREVDLTKPSGFQDVSILTHIDFTDTSGPIAMKAFMGDEAEELSKKPWAIIQVHLLQSYLSTGHIGNCNFGFVTINGHLLC